jgi:hypothetical protein
VGIKEEIIYASLTSSWLWPKFAILTLKENMRVSDNNLNSE